MSDSYGNPTHVVSGQPIESLWGNAVTDTIVHKFPTVAAFDTAYPAPPDGLMVMIGTVPYSIRAGILIAMITGISSPVGIARGNVASDGGTYDLSGVLTVGPYPAEYTALVTALVAASGSAAAGTYTPSIRNAAGTVVYGFGPAIGYGSGAQSAVSGTMHAIVPMVADTVYTFSVWVQLTGTSANQNFGGGYIFTELLPR